MRMYDLILKKKQGKEKISVARRQVIYLSN